MTKIFSKLFMLSLLVVVLFMGCEKNTDNVFSEYELVDESAYAFLKVNYNIALFNNPNRPGAQLKINGVRVGGPLSTRFPFPGGGFNTLGGSTGDYLPVAPGSLAISLSIPKKNTLIDSVELFKTTINTEVGKRYTLHVADTIAVKSLFVEENYAYADSGFVRMRFVNLIPNIPAGLDLYNGSTKVAGSIPFMGISPPFDLAIGTATSTGWAIRVGGSAANSTAVATYTLTDNVRNRRVYTAFATGWSGYSSTGTDVRRPFISFFYVR